MANPTTNFGWVMPTSTDLVTDLPADFAVFGQGVDTSLKAVQTQIYNQTVSAKTASYVLVAADKGTRVTMSNAGATTITVDTALFAAGDTLFITNIGAGACTITAGTATVSTASSLALAQYDSGRLYFTSTGVAIWEKYQGASAASGLTLIKRATVSAVATTGTTFDSIFSSSYTSYLVIAEGLLSSSGASPKLNMQMLYSGTAQATGYYGTCQGWADDGTANQRGNNNVTIYSFTYNYINSIPDQNLNLIFTGVGNTSEVANWTGTSRQQQGISYVCGGTSSVARTYTGFQFSTSVGNISGTIGIYGLAKA